MQIKVVLVTLGQKFCVGEEKFILIPILLDSGFDDAHSIIPLIVRNGYDWLSFEYLPNYSNNK